MNTVVKQTANQKPQFFVAQIQPSTNRGMVASWFMVDGKLTCKWFPAE